MRTGRNPREKLERWVHAGLDGASRPSPEFWEDVASHATIAQLCARYEHYYVRVLEAIIDEGVRDRTFRPVDPGLVARIWETTGAKLRDPAFFLDLDRPVREVAEAWVDLMVHGL